MVSDFFTSMLFIVPFTAIITGQIVKQFVFMFHGEKLSWKTLLTDGGLPSTHSATMAALATTIFYIEGFSTVFYLAFFMTLIVTKDALGVRRESGKHARLLKDVLKKLELKDPEHIKMLIGHTKTQVICGVCWGIFIAVTMHAFLF